MKTLFAGMLLSLVSANGFAAEVCTITSINARVTLACSNVNNGAPALSSENVTTSLKSKIEAGFAIVGQTADIGGPQNDKLAIVYTLMKP